jgi:hypothetical protein
MKNNSGGPLELSFRGLKLSYDIIWHQYPLLSLELYIKESFKFSELPHFSGDKSLCTKKIDETKFRRDLGLYGEEILEVFDSAPLTESIFSFSSSS